MSIHVHPSFSLSIDYYYFFFVPKIMMCMSTSKNKKNVTSTVHMNMNILTFMSLIRVRNRNNRGTVRHQSLTWPSPMRPEGKNSHPIVCPSHIYSIKFRHGNILRILSRVLFFFLFVISERKKLIRCFFWCFSSRN